MGLRLVTRFAATNHKLRTFHFQLPPMRAFLLQLCLFLAATSVVMEGFFRLSGLAPEIPAARYEANYALTLSDRAADSTGWYTYGKQAQIRAPWRINAAGWNSAFDYRPDASRPLVAVLGDSYIENLYCAPEAHLDYQMTQYLPDGYRVYGFGRRGVPMSHFVPMTQYVKDEFAPEWIVYVINHRNVAESVASLRRGRYFLQYDQQGDSLFTLPPQPYQPSRLKSLLGQSATFRYFLANFTFRIQWPRLTLSAPDTPARPAAQLPQNQAIQHRVTRRVLQDLMANAGDSRVLFVLHPNRPAVYAGQRPAPESRALGIVRTELDALGLPYLSLNRAFERAYDRDQQPFEFETNEHWNGYANAVAAEAIAAALRQRLTP